MTNQSIIDLYLDFRNNFITTSACAQHYMLPLALAESLIAFGRALHVLNTDGYDALTNDQRALIDDAI